jgi:hypothetical protein
MFRRPVLVSTAAACVTLATLVVVLPAVGATADTASSHKMKLEVLFTAASTLPATSRQTLLWEVERIWQQEGVILYWRQSDGMERPDAPLRMLVIAQPSQSAEASAERWPVAELLPAAANQRALAIVSIAGGRRVLVQAARYAILDHPFGWEYRLGLVLGRAAAHEIGHFLLATKTHAENGLMRAHVDAREFADLSADTFSLDDAASQWIGQQLRGQPTAAGTLRTAGFSYQRHTAKNVE